MKVIFKFLSLHILQGFLILVGGEYRSLSSQIRVLPVFCLLTVLATPVFGGRVYATLNPAATASNTCATITNLSNLHDGNPTTSSSILRPSGSSTLCTTFITLRFPTPQITSGTSIRIKFGFLTGNTSIYPHINIIARLDNTNVSPAYTVNLASLPVETSAESSFEYVFSPITTNNFNSIRIDFRNTAPTNVPIIIYDAYYLTGSNCEDSMDLLYSQNFRNASNGAFTPTSSTLYQADLINQTESLALKAYVTALFDFDSEPGDSLEVIFRYPTKDEPFNSFKNNISNRFYIKSYTDNLFKEDINFQQSILDKTLTTIILGGTAHYRLTYPVNQAFNRLEVGINTSSDRDAEMKIVSIKRIPSAGLHTFKVENEDFYDPIANQYIFELNTDIVIKPEYNFSPTFDPARFTWFFNPNGTDPINNNSTKYNARFILGADNTLTITRLAGFNPDPSQEFTIYGAYLGVAGCVRIRPVSFSRLAVILPIQITDFQALLEKDKKVDLTWTVLKNTIEDSQFHIERSADGVNFSKILETPANLTDAPESYSIKDNTPEFGNNYYRIKLVNALQETLYVSKTLKVDIPNSSNDYLIYPNPFTRNLTIKPPVSSSAILSYKIYRLDGKLEKEIKTSEIINGVQSLDLENLNQGMYLIIIDSIDKPYSQRIIKN